MYCDVLAAVRYNWTVFTISYGCNVTSGNSKGWVTLSTNFRPKGASPTNHCWCQKTRAIALSCGIKISAVHFVCFCYKAPVSQTYGRTVYDSQDRASIAASRCNKMLKTELAKDCSSVFKLLQHRVMFKRGRPNPAITTHAGCCHKR